MRLILKSLKAKGMELGSLGGRPSPQTSVLATAGQVEFFGSLGYGTLERRGCFVESRDCPHGFMDDLVRTIMRGTT